MAWVVNDFECQDCGHVFEELYRPQDIIICNKCTSEKVNKIVSTPKLAAFSMSTPEQKKEKLLKRSLEHTNKELSREPEKFGAAGKERAKQIRKDKPMVGYKK